MITAGLLASFGLSLFYYLVLFLFTKDALYPLRQFLVFQPWMSLLILGFGIQWALFARLRQGKMMVGGSGGHHLQGSLAFDPLQSGAQELKPIIRGIDNQNGELNWKLERR